MNTIIAVIFVLVMIILSTAGREFERADTWQTYFDRGMEVQDSLWNEIQAINLLEDKPDKKIMLIVEREIPQPCSANINRKKDEPYYGCLVYHFKRVYDTLYVDKEYIFDNYRYPEFTEDSTVCNVEDLGWF